MDGKKGSERPREKGRLNEERKRPRVRGKSCDMILNHDHVTCDEFLD